MCDVKETLVTSKQNVRQSAKTPEIAYEKEKLTLTTYKIDIAASHVLIALIVPGCVHVCLRFAVGAGLSGV